MNWNHVTALLIGAAFVALAWVFKTNIDVRQELRVQSDRISEYVKMLTKVAEALNESNEQKANFEATGYTVQPRDDGRVEVTFLKKLGPSDPAHPEKKGEMAEFRTVIMPAWMWAQVTAEAALKVGFDALDKAKKKEAEK